MRSLLFLALLLVSGVPAHAQDSGGPLSAEQAAYDVTYYGLDVAVDPEARRIAGTVDVQADVRGRLAHLVLNLDRRLQVDRAWLPSDSATALPVERRANARGADSNEVWIALPDARRPGDRVELRIAYSGAPRGAPNAPWDGGVSWKRTPSGAHWIATSCQTLGADVWWPMKDHPSDEPDSMDIVVTVPHPLRTASNGVLREVATTDSTRTDRWHVSTSINPYTVALNIAPYARIDTTHTSPDGVSFPVAFYALPSDSSRAANALPHFLEHLAFLEETLAPYPFRKDKYGIAQTPFLGMEHQTIIAYGNNFRLNGGLGYSAGFDALHFHELAHEWFGNCLTVRDWKDFWLHEGFATYTEALYAEHLRGSQGYRAVIQHNAGRMMGTRAIARTDATSAQSIYSGDVYFKGALVLHTLRYVLGDDAFFETLRRFVRDDASGDALSDTAACRHVSTADFVQIAEDVSGRELDGFFSVYLYQQELPHLVTVRDDAELQIFWRGTGDAPFTVPVPVSVDGTVRRVAMKGGRGSIAVPANAEIRLDPNGWLLRAGG